MNESAESDPFSGEPSKRRSALNVVVAIAVVALVVSVIAFAVYAENKSVPAGASVPSTQTPTQPTPTPTLSTPTPTPTQLTPTEPPTQLPQTPTPSTPTLSNQPSRPSLTPTPPSRPPLTPTPPSRPPPPPLTSPLSVCSSSGDTSSGDAYCLKPAGPVPRGGTLTLSECEVVAQSYSQNGWQTTDGLVNQVNSQEDYPRGCFTAPDPNESSCEPSGNAWQGDCDLWKWYYNSNPVGSDDCSVANKCTDGVRGSCVVNNRQTSDDSPDYSGNYRFQEEGMPMMSAITDVDECRHAVMQLENEEYVSVLKTYSTIAPYGCYKYSGQWSTTGPGNCGPYYYLNTNDTAANCSPETKCVVKVE